MQITLNNLIDPSGPQEVSISDLMVANSGRKIKSPRCTRVVCNFTRSAPGAGHPSAPTCPQPGFAHDATHGGVAPDGPFTAITDRRLQSDATHASCALPSHTLQTSGRLGAVRWHLARASMEPRSRCLRTVVNNLPNGSASLRITFLRVPSFSGRYATLKDGRSYGKDARAAGGSKVSAPAASVIIGRRQSLASSPSEPAALFNIGLHHVLRGWGLPASRREA